MLKVENIQLTNFRKGESTIESWEKLNIAKVNFVEQMFLVNPLGFQIAWFARLRARCVSK